MTQPPQIAPVRAYCLALQQAICTRLEAQVLQLVYEKN